MWLIKERDGEKVVEFRVAASLLSRQVSNGTEYNVAASVIENTSDDKNQDIEKKIENNFLDRYNAGVFPERYKGMAQCGWATSNLTLTKEQLKQIIKELE